MTFDLILTRALPPLGFALLGIVIVAAALKLLYRSLRRSKLCPEDFPLLRKLLPVSSVIALLLATHTTLNNLQLGPLPVVKRMLMIATIWAVVYLGARGVWVATKAAYYKFDITRVDNLRSRRVRTQLHFIEKLAYVTFTFLGLCTTLLQFNGARAFGESLLASAGVAGIIVGLAAQKSLGNLIAGFQIAFTQAIRIEDAVVVEGEWGWVEEINLTYVVVRIWDLRRLILPITYFLEKPFQNWTRTTAQILGSVMLEVSHQVPFQALEAKLYELLDNSPMWDRDKWVLQVVEAKERSVTLRALMTARDSPTCWDLRCHVRRGLVAFLQESYPESLPRLTVEMSESHTPERTPSWASVDREPK